MNSPLVKRNRLLGVSLLLTVFFSCVLFIGSPNDIFADTCFNSQGNPIPCPTDGSTPTGGFRTNSSTFNDGNTQAGNKTPTADSYCNIGFWGGFDAEKCFNYGLALIAYSTLSFMGWILGIAGIFLNASIKVAIIDMPGFIRNLPAIDTTWKVIRDLANMSFIFILLYAAIGTTLQLSSVNWKKMVSNVVIAALFINFSMFFTKVVIDASNILALGLYEQIAQTENFKIMETEGGISTQFMGALGVSKVYDSKDMVSTLAQKGTWAIIRA